MNDYRFKLDKGSKKFICPECNKKTFVKYTDTKSNEYLPEHYGRCDREIKCGYHLNPYKNGYSKMIWEQENGIYTPTHRKQLTPCRPQPKKEIKAPSFIPYKILAATRKGYEQNTFIQNLLHRVQFPLKEIDIKHAIEIYHLGTICKGYRAGAITFPFIDVNGNIRAIQAKQFDKTNHTYSTDFLHSIYAKDCKKNKKPLPTWLSRFLENDKIVSCLFGEHLLEAFPNNPIALVEAPKTTIIGTLYFGLPDNPKNLLWLAAYNLSSLSIEKCKVLQGRNVFLFPDLGAYDNWSNKAEQIQKELPGTGFKVSDLLEKYANDGEKERGLDIADFLIQLDWKVFRQ